VLYCVSRINLLPTTTHDGGNAPSPQEQFKGVKASYKREYGLKFAEYVEVHEYLQVTNTLEPRTRPAIALMPVGNKQCTWYFMSMDTHRVLKRDQWTKLPMPNWVIDAINLKASDQASKLKRHVVDPNNMIVTMGDENKTITADGTENEPIEIIDQESRLIEERDVNIPDHEVEHEVNNPAEQAQLTETGKVRVSDNDDIVMADENLGPDLADNHYAVAVPIR
jgi:hypothetical protein